MHAAVFVLFVYVVHVFGVQGEEVHKIINEKGCLAAGEEWLDDNLLLVAGVAVGVAFLQVNIYKQGSSKGSVPTGKHIEAG